MSLHIVLGVPDSKPTSEPFAVYVGRSGTAAREAMAKSAAPRFLILANPGFISKNNARAVENSAAAERAAKPAKPAK